MTTSCVLYAPRCVTTAPAGTFTRVPGRCLRCHRPPLVTPCVIIVVIIRKGEEGRKEKVRSFTSIYIYLDVTHTQRDRHTHTSLTFAWQARDNVHCQGVGCTPWRSSGVPWSPPLFAWHAWDNVHCQGVGCTPWRPSGVPWSPPLLRGMRGTMSIAKGSDVRPGVPLVSLGLRRFCVAGVGQRPLPRGRMYALAFLWCPLVSVAFAWQAWDNVHCQGVRCTPWRPSGVPWSPPLLRGRRGTMSTAKGSHVALASLWCPLVSAFAWHAWDNVHCQGVG